MLLSNSKAKALRNLKVKVGHGGTLDPLATGVLIVGVGKGTKHLGKFLECTKSYECVVLFGAATDSYDAVGKVVSRAPYDHVTRDLVEEKLAQFRGNIMQKPSIFSALKVDGKKMYEYAREGGHVPEVAARAVEVKELELIEWLEPGSHDFKLPDQEVGLTEKEGAEKLMGIRAEDATISELNARGRKRSRSPENEVENVQGQPKKPRTASEPAMSGALPVGNAQQIGTARETARSDGEPAASDTQPPPESETATPLLLDSATKTSLPQSPSRSQSKTQPPAARLRMTVTSGFYVRSLCHDLGLACSSLGLMSSLIRTRQGDYTLGSNVVEYSALESGASVWEPKIQDQLEDFMKKEGWEAEKVEDEETWQAIRRERQGERREEDRNRSFQKSGQGKGGGNWREGKRQWRNGRDKGRDY